MKTIPLPIVALLLAVCTATAQTYTVLSSTTNRTIAPTGYGLRLLTNSNAAEVLALITTATTNELNYVSGVTSAIQTQLDSKPTIALTNVATLSGTNGITFRTLYSLPTNAFIPSVAVSTLATATNNGGYTNLTAFLELDMPPLASSNSMVSFSVQQERTNVNAAAAFMVFYVGDNTNFIGDFAAGATTVARSYSPVPGNFIMLSCDGSLTNQWIASPTFTTHVNKDGEYNYSSNWFNGNSTWKLKVGLYTTVAAYTNWIIRNFTVTETIR